MLIYNPFFNSLVPTYRVELQERFQSWGKCEWDWDDNRAFDSLVKHYVKDFD